MPEHHAATPGRLRDLESFLWHDFEDGLGGWIVWVRRTMPQIADVAAEAAFDPAMQLHAALRSLEAANNGIGAGEAGADRETLNRLIDRYAIRPRLDDNGEISFVSDASRDPLTLLILAALEAMRSASWRRFKLCREPTCRASYYDASKAAVKTWCSMATCGSRNKMRRYRARG